MSYTIASSYRFSPNFSFNKGLSIALVRPKAVEGLEDLALLKFLENKMNKSLRQEP
jgi:hypothetical protein